MNKHQIIVGPERFEYRPTTEHLVFVDSNTPNGKWRVTAVFNAAHVMTKPEHFYDDVFTALNEAWRIALVVQHIGDEASFTNVCVEAMDMIALHPSAVLPFSLARAVRADAEAAHASALAARAAPRSLRASAGPASPVGAASAPASIADTKGPRHGG